MTTRISALVIDGAEPTKLPESCRRISRWNITSSDEDHAYLVNGAGIQLGFQPINRFAAKRWPNDRKPHPPRLHRQRCRSDDRRTSSAGPAKPEFQPRGRNWVVLTDPEGHSSCPSPEN
jgi:hypothetical protein